MNSRLSENCTMQRIVAVVRGETKTAAAFARLTGYDGGRDPIMIRFTTSTLLLLTAFVAITLGVIHAAHRINGYPWDWAGPELVNSSPYWMPLVFAAYAAGRRTLSLRLVLIFAAVEVLTLAGVYWEWRISVEAFQGNW
jgi:hypothetical protein